ncbi:DUF885 domain-containing protein [Luteimonas sp. MC1572]|uniref:DUF885 domain-containing protein n=1 Tax=Luteimonas sp. MC1572 TaxID=2799325 RepID=UPI0018F0C51A|nr:DUF885 domain-containing protein [Luteimonas sp. MC1572]MBJ6982692.1 DUF885 domain-containing protein [Luteimonas sp. MC1572]QQO03934.1 DUF885 domain-containing protein [Luteimonas sp. MC1572]
MSRPLLATSLLALALAACQAPAPSTPIGTDAAATQATSNAQDAAFAALSARFLDEGMALSPISATQVGDHRFDTEVDDLSAAGRQKSIDWARALLADLDKVDASALSRENQVDALILRNALEGTLWDMETMQSWAWDPQVYSGLAGGAIYNLMAREFAPMPERLKSAAVRMEKIPVLLAQARENLDPARVPKTHAETVARQNKGVLTLVDTFITPNADQLAGADRARLDAGVATLRKAVEEHQKWLDGTLVPNAKGEFRIGAERYDQKLKFSLNSSLSRQEIHDRATAELARVRDEMYAIAQVVLKDKPGAPATPAAPDDDQRQAAIEAALEFGYADKPARDEVVDFAKYTLDEATKFVRAKDLVTVPDDPVKIILMPEFQRGFSVAYCDSPGPLDKGLDTYYAISPIPDEWSDSQVDSFLREYNKRLIHVLSIHEAMPGHYLEGAHSANHPSTLRAVMRSGPFAEGWAVYTERVVADAGYLDNDPLFRLMQLKFYARAVANAILDQGVHVENWTKEQAMDLMVRQTFQQQSEADGKWIRAQLSSTQLATYFVGAQEHFDMRRAVEAKEGDAFDLKRYHDRVLAQGAPPVRFARQLLLDEPIQ